MQLSKENKSQISNIKDFWDCFWEIRQDVGSQNDILFQELSTQTIMKFLKPGCSILNVGCGDGNGSDKYCSIAADIVGVDYSTKAIKKANEIHHDLVSAKRAKFIVGDILEIQPELINKFCVVITERCLL